MQGVLVSVLLALTIGTTAPACDACAMQLDIWSKADQPQAVYYCSDCAADGIGKGCFCVECFGEVHSLK